MKKKRFFLPFFKNNYLSKVDPKLIRLRCSVRRHPFRFVNEKTLLSPRRMVQLERDRICSCSTFQRLSNTDLCKHASCNLRRCWTLILVQNGIWCGKKLKIRTTVAQSGGIGVDLTHSRCLWPFYVFFSWVHRREYHRQRISAVAMATEAFKGLPEVFHLKPPIEKIQLRIPKPVASVQQRPIPPTLNQKVNLNSDTLNRSNQLYREST